MTKTSRKRSARDTSGAAHAALDVMLTDAAVGGRERFVRPGAAVGVAAGLARRPDRAARRVGHLGAELARVATGRSCGQLPPRRLLRRAAVGRPAGAGLVGDRDRP